MFRFQLLFENQTIVVSPLVSLMDDQVNTLKDLNVKAERCILICLKI